MVKGYDLVGQFRLRKFSGKMESFLYGSLTEFRKIGSYNFYFEYKKKYGETFVMWFGMDPRLYTANADHVKKVSFNFKASNLKH